MSRKSQYNRFRRARGRAETQGYVHHREGGIGLPCPYCGVKMTDHIAGGGVVKSDTATRDHVRPKCEGGRTLLIVCSACNHEKADRGPQSWLKYLFQSGQIERAMRVYRAYLGMRSVLPEGLSFVEIVAESPVNDDSQETQPQHPGDAHNGPV